MEKTLKAGQAMPHAIQLAITEHGAWRVLAAAVLTLLRRKAVPVVEDPTERLSDHLRRDIGLPPRGSPPPRVTVPLPR